MTLRIWQKRGNIDAMYSSAHTIRAYFFKLGLSSEIADIYVALHACGSQTISELARSSGVERTRIYRLMDELKASGLVEIGVQYKQNIFTAAPIANLQSLLAEKEQELRELQTELHGLQRIFSAHSLKNPATKVQSYQGIEGLKQMFWNQARSGGENVSILYENMQVRTRLAFFERWVQACNERGMTSRGIISDNFIRTQQEWYKKYKNERLASWQGRYIPDKVFSITHSTVIYGNVTAYFNWKDSEIFGIEIYNQEIADAQRQFFEILWSQGVAINDLTFPVKE